MLDYGEWLAEVVHKNDGMVEHYLKVGFEAFDRENKGGIDLKEMVGILAKNLKEYISDEETWK